MRLLGTLTRRLVGTVVDLLTWRARLAQTGINLRLRSLVSTLTILGGVGTAIGFAVVDRLERRALDAEDETIRRQE
jgi:hypothetical protein